MFTSKEISDLGMRMRNDCKNNAILKFWGYTPNSYVSEWPASAEDILAGWAEYSSESLYNTYEQGKKWLQEAEEALELYLEAGS